MLTCSLPVTLRMRTALHKRNYFAHSMDVSCSGSTPIKRSNGRLTTSPSNEQASPQTWKNDTPGCSTATGGAAAVKMFRVLLDPPSAGAFFSGSEVRGHVQVDTEDEQKFKYIHISLTGRAQVRCILVDAYLELFACGAWLPTPNPVMLACIYRVMRSGAGAEVVYIIYT